jgi:hypothetical protein
VASKDHTFTVATPPFQTDLGGVITIDPTNSLLQPDQLSSLPQCQCRESLVTLVPGVNQAMQEKQLDKVFKRMQGVIDGFQDIIRCTECNITCVDLICIMSVFQQTGTGFQYIAEADRSGAINMNFGGHEVPINDPKLRAMLVTSLIYQATSVLDAISAKGQHMLQMFSTPPPIARANINHLDTVIADFRNLLHKMADVADKAASPPEEASTVISTGNANQTC